MKLKLSSLFLFLAVLCLIALPGRQAFAQAADTVYIGVFSDVVVAPDAVVEVPIEVKQAKGLFAVDIEMTFDPDIVTVQDADPDRPGVQLGLGDFLDPGLLLNNSVDNETGRIQFIMSQVNPSEPKDGDGVLLVLYLQGKREGETELRITKLQAADNRGLELPSGKVEARVSVEAGAPAPAATSIPVVNPTAAILLPTPQAQPTQTPPPGPTATLSRMPTAAPTAIPTEPQPAASEPTSALAQEQPVEEKAPLENPAAEPVDEGGFSLLENWWIVAAAVAVASGLAIYVVRSK